MAGNLRDAPPEINVDAARLPVPGQVRRVLDLIRPGLLADGGNLELIAIDEDGTVRIELQGACQTCPAAEMTRRHAIEPLLRSKLHGVTAVVLA
jgi:Fe-S cluster biogenesis protein NfuA